MNSKNNTHTCTNEDIEVVYNLVNYYKRIPNYATITTLPEENAQYIKEALPTVINCASMLKLCRKLTSVDTTGWDTSNIECMSLMFYACEALETLDVSKWDTSKVTNMSCMFSGCNKLTTLDVSNWDISKVTDMRYMFNGCTSLTTIKGVIDMKSCTSYDSMFDGCYNLSGVKIKNPPSGITATSGIGGLKAGKYKIVS